MVVTKFFAHFFFLKKNRQLLLFRCTYGHLLFHFGYAICLSSVIITNYVVRLVCQTCNNDHDAGMFRKLLKNLFTHRNCLDYLVILCLLLIINLDLIYFFFLGTVQESLSLITTTACFFRSLVLVVIFLKMIKLDDFSIDQMCIEETHEKHVAIWKETSL